MDKSIDALGENLAVSMRTAMADSVEIVENLAKKTDALKDLYDSYFAKVEDQSNKMMDEMDFTVQKIFTTFTNETALIIDRLADNSSNTLETLEKGISGLVINIDENSRSIGLYAKEINMDISELSRNLREAVKDFSDHLNAGIGNTLKDFDQGLAEVTLRLASVLENIQESAEALQKALNRY
jgi:gas vesicle protein